MDNMNRYRQQRLKLGLSIEEMAILLDYSERAITSWERSERVPNGVTKRFYTLLEMIPQDDSIDWSGRLANQGPQRTFNDICMACTAWGVFCVKNYMDVKYILCDNGLIYVNSWPSHIPVVLISEDINEITDRMNSQDWSWSYEYWSVLVKKFARLRPSLFPPHP